MGIGEILHEGVVKVLGGEEEGKEHWRGIVTNLGGLNELLKRFDQIKKDERRAIFETLFRTNFL